MGSERENDAETIGMVLRLLARIFQAPIADWNYGLKPKQLFNLFKQLLHAQTN